MSVIRPHHRASHAAPLAYSGLRALAISLLADAVTILRRPVRRRYDEARRAYEVAFFRDPARCAKWCEMAGYDYGAIVSKLDAQGLLVPSTVIDVDADEPLPDPTPARPAKPRRGAQVPVERRGKVGRIPSPHKGVQRILSRLPRNAGAACTAHRMAAAIGVSVGYVNTELRRLEREGRVACLREARFGRRAAGKWWKLP